MSLDRQSTDSEDGNRTSEQILKLAKWNVQGLVSKRNYKLKNNDLIKTPPKYDIILLSETWTNQHSDMSLIGYDHAELHRTRPKNARRDSGGVAVYYESHIII